MGKGRKPTPRGIKALQRDRTKPAPNAGPQFGEPSSRPPEHLGPQAAELWAKLAPQLTRNDLLTVADEEALAVYCECWQQYQEVLGLLRDGGYTQVNSHGTSVANPLCAQLHALRDQLRKWASEFGFTPAAREKIKGVSVPTNPDEVEEFLRAV